LPTGFVNVYKPCGVTSHDVVDFVRDLTGDPRVGHCGTLDPRAEGVLPLALGPATRLAELFVADTKSYVACARLDLRTDTGDLDGIVKERFGGPIPSIDRLRETVELFLGEQLQTVPAYSAVKVGGRRLYEIARSGGTVSRPVRTITVEEMVVMDYDWPIARLRVRCSKGTYIRQLVEDLGSRLGVGGSLLGLVRTSVGRLSVDDAISPWTLAATWVAGELERCLVPWELVAAGRLLTLADPDSGRRLRSGVWLPLSAFRERPLQDGLLLVMSGEGEPLALGSLEIGQDGAVVRPRRVLVR
jgi:tRNA pseudouridine55 synthase